VPWHLREWSLTLASWKLRESHSWNHEGEKGLLTGSEAHGEEYLRFLIAKGSNGEESVLFVFQRYLPLPKRKRTLLKWSILCINLIRPWDALIVVRTLFWVSLQGYFWMKVTFKLKD
jgi:hypothetical protein